MGFAAPHFAIRAAIAVLILKFLRKDQRQEGKYEKEMENIDISSTFLKKKKFSLQINNELHTKLEEKNIQKYNLYKFVKDIVKVKIKSPKYKYKPIKFRLIQQ